MWITQLENIKTKHQICEIIFYRVHVYHNKQRSFKRQKKWERKTKTENTWMLVVHCNALSQMEELFNLNQMSFPKLASEKRAKRDENEEKVGKIHGCLRSAGAVRESPSSPPNTIFFPHPTLLLSLSPTWVKTNAICRKKSPKNAQKEKRCGVSFRDCFQLITQPPPLPGCPPLFTINRVEK